MFQFRKIEKNLKNAKNFHFPIFIEKKGPNRVVQDRTKWSKIGGLTVVNYKLPMVIYG